MVDSKPLKVLFFHSFEIRLFFILKFGFIQLKAMNICTVKIKFLSYQISTYQMAPKTSHCINSHAKVVEQEPLLQALKVLGVSSVLE